MKVVFWIPAFAGMTIGLIGLSVLAHEGQPISYFYEHVQVKIEINEDSTFDVEERQTFNYVGNYHVGWRTVSLNKIDAVSDIQVFDGSTGMPLQYSSKRLNKLDPLSSGKYTAFRESGAQNIEWYYDLADTTHTWVLRYKVHGGIAFGKAQDRLYWNIFTDYGVPVNSASISVQIPEAVGREAVAMDAYRNAALPISKEYNQAVFTFSSGSFAPKEDFTIDTSWPKGIVRQSAYWKDFVKIYYGYIGGAVSLLLAFGIGFWFWLTREKLPKGRGTIVSQYEPPQDLPPAMAEVIVKEKLTPKGLAATVVDLAIKGYIRIAEDNKKSLGKGLSWGIFIILLFFFPQALLVLAVIALFKLAISGSKGLKELFVSKEYIIHKINEYSNDLRLETYEKSYLDLLFISDGHFSTRELKRRPAIAKAMHQNMIKLKEDIYKETETDTKAFIVPPSKEVYKTIIWTTLIVLGFVLLLAMKIVLNQMGVFLLGLTLSGIGLWAFLKYEARLNEEGRILKEEWLGFKMYLEVAEKYRMQNLTPELFEKFLPYAMIFGVEKQWSKNFESMHLPSPTWYAGGVYAGGTVSPSAVSFSPSAFSASFSSAFTSAFASSGAGGGGAGGGGAGGGGGGGGGGAG